jgi:hypothetical protein
MASRSMAKGSFLSRLRGTSAPLWNAEPSTSTSNLTCRRQPLQRLVLALGQVDGRVLLLDHPHDGRTVAGSPSGVAALISQ